MGHLGINQGEIYSNSTFPICTSTDINYDDEDLTDLRSGKSAYRNIMKVVEVGDGGIHRAMKKGKLNKASLVTVRIHKINIPIGFIPIYYKETKTTVYGTAEEDL